PRTADGVVALGLDPRSERQVQSASLAVQRSEDPPHANRAMVRAALAVGSDLGRSACPLGRGDSTPLVGPGDCADDARVAGFVLTRHLARTSQHTMWHGSDETNGLVCQVGADLFGCLGHRTPNLMAAAAFFKVHAHTECAKNIGTPHSTPDFSPV